MGVGRNYRMAIAAILTYSFRLVLIHTCGPYTYICCEYYALDLFKEPTLIIYCTHLLERSIASGWLGDGDWRRVYHGLSYYMLGHCHGLLHIANLLQLLESIDMF